MALWRAVDRAPPFWVKFALAMIYLAFLWHMHQPYYKNLHTGQYLLPWVLLHGTKDYFDMPYMLREFPGLKQNYNLVPSLMVQLADYEDPEVSDVYLDIFSKDARELTADERTFIIVNFFNANWDRMIKRYPRYYELLRKRGFYYAKERAADIQRYFTDDELRDIQVFFLLCWIDPLFLEVYDDLQVLHEKGGHYTEGDKAVIRKVQRAILSGTVPLYRQLADQGFIELSTSPFYHPIVPLLIDSQSARESMPGVVLPQSPFRHEDDADHQIAAAKAIFSKTFGKNPAGMWPPEGSVSDEALRLYVRNGVEWVATDEDILFHSLGTGYREGFDRHVPSPELLYRPYRFDAEEGAIRILFRDRLLSDLISFQYSRMGAKEAASDCLRKLHEIDRLCRGKVSRPIVTIAMDGENAWEHYSNDGRDFLRYLYEGILDDTEIVCTTISDYIASRTGEAELHHCFAGSWINRNFAIWIGHPEDNMAWDYLAATRSFLQAKDPEKTNADAWESLYIAEGSDWFWWYGDEHASENDEIFDLLFRESLSNVYRFLGEEPPAYLAIPILVEDREVHPAREPANLIQPIVDGKVTNYFEWLGSGFLGGQGRGVAMHSTRSLMTGCHYGFGDHSISVRIDFDRSFVRGMESPVFVVHCMGRKKLKIAVPAKGPAAGSPSLSYACGEILEVQATIDALDVSAGDTIQVCVELKEGEVEVDRMPKRGYLSITVPSESFEAEMWYV